MKNLIVLVIFAVFFIADILVDLSEGVALFHVLHEVVLFLIAVGSIIWQLKIIFKKNQDLNSLNTQLLEAKNSYLEWKKKSHTSAQEIRHMIDEQFGLWHLSHSEKDVALLLIKGLSMKEIAEIRKTQEKTVRQQATTIYRKGNLSGRQELAAFFLEDILSSPISDS